VPTQIRLTSTLNADLSSYLLLVPPNLG
jgi:hypothetical protein